MSNRKGKMFGRFLIGLLFVFGFASHAVAATDVAVLDDITFSKETFFVGDTVRVYASLRNTGDTDITGDVFFYLGSESVGGAHEISIPKNGQKEEVFTDMIVPEGEFNVRVVIANIVPPDINVSNNEVLSQLFQVVVDTDGDRVADTLDNCASVKNEDQRDLDHDGEGNVCDDDMDGDGVSNTVEQTNGTDPLSADTDGDGISDKNDSTPLGEPLVAPKEEVPVKKTEPVATTSETSSTSENGGSDPETSSTAPLAEGTNTDETILSASSSTSEKTLFETSEQAVSAPEASVNALFTFEESRWATYDFRIVAPVQDGGYRYEWDFGDGTTSNRREVTHYYGRTGTFTVALRMTDPEGVVSEDTVDVQIAFFDIQNRSVRMLIIFLVMILLIGISAFFRLGHDDEVSVQGEKPKPKKKTTKISKT